jgi:hypothetical protein
VPVRQIPTSVCLVGDGTISDSHWASEEREWAFSHGYVPLASDDGRFCGDDPWTGPIVAFSLQQILEDQGELTSETLEWLGEMNDVPWVRRDVGPYWVFQAEYGLEWEPTDPYEGYWPDVFRGSPLALWVEHLVERGIYELPDGPEVYDPGCYLTQDQGLWLLYQIWGE